MAAVGDGLLVCPWDLCEHHARIRELADKYADQAMDLANVKRARRLWTLQRLHLGWSGHSWARLVACLLRFFE